MNFTFEDLADGSVVALLDGSFFMRFISRYELVEFFNALSPFISTRKAA